MNDAPRIVTDAARARRAIDALRKPDHAFANVPNTVRQSVADVVEDLVTQVERAERALTRAGYTYTEGAEEWKPPIGPSASPLLDKIDLLRAALKPFAEIREVAPLGDGKIDRVMIEISFDDLRAVHKAFSSDERT